ncbi:metallophosphoesterase family protein [Conexibacter woesei]|uniref:Metallophosphoesterase n=1 Tax=Conexibacter woesei (strain DSM 14684 / CCUG 47730 / CIP 108061 / JCM 11494 / NBRC 100937 / ID131577) TaxID=469383 RepID=D3FDN1_CONWI|nr:metallophosphoesterase family protein [Conexibacter woesei]ADB49605.1 metallophosphoesterase [Conexibacter woesei DSM 14684]
MLAVLYDVHGNLPALDAVLADARVAGASRWLLGGDYALFGAWPAETIARLGELTAAIWIRGNGERWVNAPAEALPPARAAARWCADQLGPDTVARLAALPEQAVLDGVRYCHASPVSDMIGVLPESQPGEGALFIGVREPRLVFGHTHLPLERVTDQGLELLNPGSVGMPFDRDPRAAYALVGDDGTVQRRRVAYDHAASAAAVRAALGADGELVARRIEQARVDPEMG